VFQNSQIVVNNALAINRPSVLGL